MLTQNEILIERSKGVGILSADDAINYSAAGPLLRGSGVAYDIRRADPYSIYPELDFDVAGEYLYLAATLLLLKSKTCITEEENKKMMEQLGAEEGLNITSQSELVRRLEELQKFQKIGQNLWLLPKKGHEIFVKPKINRKTIVNSILTPMDLEKLTLAMVEYIFKQKRKYTVVKRDRLSIKEKLKYLKQRLKVGEKITLMELLDQDGDAESIDNIVITFISLLELGRLQRLKVFQNEDRGTIYVEVTKSLEDFDVESANGFEEEGAEQGSAMEDEELGETILAHQVPGAQQTETGQGVLIQ